MKWVYVLIIERDQWYEMGLCAEYCDIVNNK